MRIEYDPMALDTPMVCAAHSYDSQCVKCRQRMCQYCRRYSHLYEKRRGTIESKSEYVMRVKLDNGRYVYLNPHWGCGGSVSPRVVVGARVKVYRRDWRLFYRMVGQ